MGLIAITLFINEVIPAMLSRSLFITALLLTSLVNWVNAEQQVLFDFIKPTASDVLSLDGVNLANAMAEENQQGERLRRVSFTTITKPQFTLTAINGYWDLSNAKSISLRIQNAMDWDITINVDLKNKDNNTILHASVALPAGPAQTLLIPLTETSGRKWGMRIGVTKPWLDTGVLYLLPTETKGNIDSNEVSSISLSIDAPSSVQNILVGEIAVSTIDAERLAYTHLVDQYGQNTRLSWPEKISNDQQLLASQKTEQKQLQDWAKSVVKEDGFGGLGDKPQFRATGYFRTEKFNGQWFLVTPKGHAFVSLGVNTVDHDNSQTYIDHREFMFDGLPEKNNPLSAFYGYANTRSGNAAQGGRGVDKGKWYDFYHANLYRISPKNTIQYWRDNTVKRLKAWGFNTLGNWSNVDLIKQKKLPYVLPILIKGDYSTVSSGVDWWGAMPDPFDPRFAMFVERAVAIATKGHKTDPWLIGYFADNELAWGGVDDSVEAHYALAINTLKLSTDSPAKQIFLKQLRNKYTDSQKLASSWGISLDNWQQIEQKGFNPPLPNNLYPMIERDYSYFLEAYADAYFKTIKDSLIQHDDHHLFLGSRFASKTPEAIKSCATYCDVISFNIYTSLPKKGYDSQLIKNLDKPIIISEFSFGSKDKGSLWAGPIEVADETARSKAYHDFISEAFKDPHVVGAHWFQYIDEPITGRLLDGENGHLGLVSITDKPFNGFIETVRETNRAVLKRFHDKSSRKLKKTNK